MSPDQLNAYETDALRRIFSARPETDHTSFPRYRSTARWR